MTDETRLTLLGRMRNGDWAEFDRLYRPFLLSWLARRGLQPADAENVTQDAVVKAFEHLGGFVHSGPGSFRAWLRAVVNSAVIDWARRSRRVPVAGLLPDAHLDALEARDDPLAREWDAEYDRYLVGVLVGRVAHGFSADVMARFRLSVLDGLSAADVATRVGGGEAAVYQARSRVLARLREAAGELLD